MASNRSRLITVSIAVVAGVGAALWMSRDVISERVEEREERVRRAQDRASVYESWNALEFEPTPASATPELVSASRRLFENAEGLELDRAQAEALAAELSRELAARSGTVEAYVAARSSEETSEWIDASDERAWKVLSYFLEGNDLEVPPRDRPGDALPLLARKKMNDRGTRFVGWSPRDAAAAAVYRASSIDEVAFEGYRMLGEEALDFFVAGSGHNAIRTRKPRVTAEEIIRRERSVLCANALMVVKTEAGEPITWRALWVFDPQTSRWYAEQIGCHGPSQHSMFY